jgi:DNA-binding transcriptional regulator LsrR (DeoR family)
MTRLRRAAASQLAIADDQSLRLRAAWLYHSHGLTQSEVSDRLGVSRGTVIRLLAEASQRGEVQFYINEGVRDCVDLGLQLERTLDLDEAIVVPATSTAENAAQSVGLALGMFLSEVVTDDMTIGVGWGRTLMSSLTSLRPARRERVRVVSLLGGVVETRGTNPLEFSWRIANQFGGDCFLFLSPIFVDSPATKRRLIEKCGLGELFQRAGTLDLAIISAGDVGPGAKSVAAKIVSREEIKELANLGAVCDVLCNFLDAEGRSVDHSLNRRVMSVELDDLKKAKHLVIASGGPRRAPAILAAIKRVGCNTLITDESVAQEIIETEASPKDRLSVVR